MDLTMPMPEWTETSRIPAPNMPERPPNVLIRSPDTSITSLFLPPVPEDNGNELIIGEFTHTASRHAFLYRQVGVELLSVNFSFFAPIIYTKLEALKLKKM